jgi:hypothetical protein
MYWLVFVAALAVAAPIALLGAQDAPEDVLEGIEAQLEHDWLALDSVEMDEVDGDTVYTVRYDTREINMVAYRSEMLEVFRLVGEVEALDDGDVVLIPQIDVGGTTEGVEAATASAGSVRSLAQGDMTRSDFLDIVDIAPLEHHSSGRQSPA